MIAALAHTQRFAGMCIQHQSTAGKRAKVNADSETFQNFAVLSAQTIEKQNILYYYIGEICMRQCILAV